MVLRSRVSLVVNDSVTLADVATEVRYPEKLVSPICFFAHFLNISLHGTYSTRNQTLSLELTVNVNLNQRPFTGPHRWTLLLVGSRRSLSSVNQ